MHVSRRAQLSMGPYSLSGHSVAATQKCKPGLTPPSTHTTPSPLRSCCQHSLYWPHYPTQTAIKGSPGVFGSVLWLLLLAQDAAICTWTRFRAQGSSTEREAFGSDLDSLSPRNEAKKEKKKSTQRRQFKTFPLIIFPRIRGFSELFFPFFSSANMKRVDRSVE